MKKAKNSYAIVPLPDTAEKLRQAKKRRIQTVPSGVLKKLP